MLFRSLAAPNDIAPRRSHVEAGSPTNNFSHFAVNILGLAQRIRRPRIYWTEFGNHFRNRFGFDSACSNTFNGWSFRAKGAGLTAPARQRVSILVLGTSAVFNLKIILAQQLKPSFLLPDQTWGLGADRSTEGPHDLYASEPPSEYVRSELF